MASDIDLAVKIRAPFVGLGRAIVWLGAPFADDADAWASLVAKVVARFTWIRVEDGRWFRCNEEQAP